MKNLQNNDPQINNLINSEIKRQQNGLVMIASENIASPAVLESMGTPLSNKYAEGYPGKRYYTGNKYIDQIENLAIERAKKLFNAEHVNVQPNSGSTANAAAYFSVLNNGDKILGLELSQGGHLTHGSPVNFSGKTYNFISYGVDPITEMIDMNRVREIALREKPKMIVCGATAYSRTIDFETFGKIAREINAYLLADISHIVGLILAGVHPSPAGHADIITTTTHKTLKGPRSAIIISRIEDPYQNLYFPKSKKNLAQRIDSAIFPGLQGGPLEHVIAAKAVAFQEAMSDKFKDIQKQTIKNAQVIAKILQENGIKIISGGTDNHLLLVDCTSIGTTGKIATNWLERGGIYTNFNTIPNEKRSPFDPSGIRIGTPTLSSRGMKEKEMEIIANVIVEMLKNIESIEVLEKTKQIVNELTVQFPIYQDYI